MTATVAMPGASDLPYYLPKDEKSQLKALARILGIPSAMAEQAGTHGIEAMTGTILYRHLDRRQRMAAMERIKSLPDREFASKLVRLTLETTFVNPQWGLWSLTNEELEKDIRFHRAVGRVGAITGATLSISSGKDIVNGLLRNGRLSPQGIALLVIGVAFMGNDTELDSALQERERRSQVKTSPYH